MTPSALSARFFALFLMAVACRPASPLITEELDIARRYLAGDVDSFPNRTETHILCVLRSVPGQNTKFVVIDRSTRMIVVEGSFTPGYVEWKGAEVIEVLSVPGDLKRGEDLSKYIKTIRIVPKN